MALSDSTCLDVSVDFYMEWFEEEIVLVLDL